MADDSPDFILMDRKNIAIGGPYDKIEHCDLIRNKTDFIHVKYYRSSSALSHLFAQGLLSAEAFAKDTSYREKLNRKLPCNKKIDNPEERPDTGKYKVVYAIATNKSIPSELPFFSKVTLKNALKTLRALGYAVELARIGIDPSLQLTKTYKPRKNG